MTCLKRPARTVVLAFVSTLAFAAGASALETSASDDPASASAAPLQELDEIRVHGQRLADRIEAAEDDFFRRYNARNEDDRFDVVCGMVALNPGSMIMTRTCVPGFVADRVPPRNVRAVSFRAPERITQPVCHPPVVVVDGAAHFEGGCYGGISPTYYQQMDSFVGDGAYRDAAAPLTLQALHLREQYADTVLAVIQADTQLQEMAAHLATLYDELESTQRHLRAVKSAIPPAWSLQRKLGAPGPRGR